ncbi:MAG: hypothetical protein K2J11_05215 [Oscillospiraceae bacterium]|nr:hypothetical protein [Oscillospiraceae bacterium]
MKDEDYGGKTLVFSPSGFILKLIFSIALTVFMGSVTRNGMGEGVSIAHVIFCYALIFVMLWFVATLFGFCLRATGNYIVAIILMVILLVLLAFGSEWLTKKNASAGTIAGIVFLVALVWLPINDVRKAILYIKNTI